MGNETCTNFCEHPEQEIVVPGNVHINILPPNTSRSIFQKTPRENSLLMPASEPIAPPIIPQPIDKLIREYTIQKLLGRSITTQPWRKQRNIYYRAILPQDDELGAGIFIVKDLESVYVGEFNKNFKCTGEGLLIAGDHSQYKGEFVNGMANGHGKLIENSVTAEGMWQNGVLVSGKIVGEGYEYEGELKDGKPHGQGHYRKGPYYFYEGDFKEGLYDGAGIESGERYIYNGEWKRGKKQGSGRIQYEDSSTYNGHWVADKKDGQGVFVSKTGAKWEGLWSEGQPQKGRWFWNN